MDARLATTGTNLLQIGSKVVPRSRKLQASKSKNLEAFVFGDGTSTVYIEINVNTFILKRSI